MTSCIAGEPGRVAERKRSAMSPAMRLIAAMPMNCQRVSLASAISISVDPTGVTAVQPP